MAEFAKGFGLRDPNGGSRRDFLMEKLDVAKELPAGRFVTDFVLLTRRKMLSKV